MQNRTSRGGSRAKWTRLTRLFAARVVMPPCRGSQARGAARVGLPAAVVVVLLVLMLVLLGGAEASLSPASAMGPAKQQQHRLGAAAAAYLEPAAHRKLAQAQDPSASGCESLIPLTLHLKWVYQGQFAGYIAASKRGFYNVNCLSVELIPGPPGSNIYDGPAEFFTPWYLDFLGYLQRGHNLLHIAQVFERQAWRYLRMPDGLVYPGVDPELVRANRNPSQDFAGLSGGAKFGIHTPALNYQLVTLLQHYNKTYCGTNDWQTGEEVVCNGSEDVEFVVVGLDIREGAKWGLPFLEAMSYSELGQILAMTVGGEFVYTTNSPVLSNNIVVHTLTGDIGIQLLEDGAMVNKTWAEQNLQTVSAFTEASFKGWIYCRDNEEECVDMIAPAGGNAAQQQYRTLQFFQMREVNRLIWPSTLGIGIHNETATQILVTTGVQIGYLNASGTDSFAALEAVTDRFALEAHASLKEQGVDVFGESFSRTTLSLCFDDGQGYVVPCSEDSLFGGWRLLVIILVPALMLMAVVGALGYHAWRLRQRLSNLKEEAKPRPSKLDLDAPITKVIALMQKLDEAEENKLTQELRKELKDVRMKLQDSPDFHIPDLQRQLLSMDSKAYGKGLTKYLIESTTGYQQRSASERGAQGGQNGHSGENGVGIQRRRTALGGVLPLMCGNLEVDADLKPNRPNLTDSQKHCDSYTEDMQNFTLAVHPDADDMMSTVGEDPFFNMLAFGSYGSTHLLLTVALHIFQTVHNLVSPLQIDYIKMVNFFKALEAGMKTQSYHNVFHAADSMSRLSAIAKMANICDEESTMELRRELAAALTATVIPVYEHPGRTNSFQIRTQSPAAVQYNQQHVNQNSALHKCLQILNDPQNNFICHWSPEEQGDFRSDVIQLVIGTDIDQHFDLLTRFQMRVSLRGVTYGPERAADYMRGADRMSRLQVLQLMITCASHGCVLLPYDVHRRWVERLQREHFEQGDEEAKLGLMVGGLMNRRADGVLSPMNQVGWYDIMVLPALREFSSVFTACHALFTAAVANRDVWSTVAETESSRGSQHPGSLPNWRQYLEESSRGTSRSQASTTTAEKADSGASLTPYDLVYSRTLSASVAKKSPLCRPPMGDLL